MVRYKDILSVLEEAERPLTYKEIADTLPDDRFDYTVLYDKLEKLVARGQVKKEVDGVGLDYTVCYQLPQS